MKNLSIKHLVLLLMLSFLWAGTFIFVKIADENLDPLIIMAARAIISTVFLFIVLPLAGKPLLSYFRNKRYQLVNCISGLLIAYMWLTIAYSEQVISAAMGSLLLTGLVPFTWIIASFITREKPFYSVNFFGIIIATIGIAIMIGFKNIIHANNQLWAALLYISGLATFACAAALNKKMSQEVSPLITITFNLFYVTIILTIIAFLFANPFSAHYTKNTILSLVALGLFSTGIGYLLYFYLSHYTGLVFAALSSYLVPIFGFFMGLFLLHEQVMPHQYYGLIVALLGMILVQRKKQPH